MFCLRNINLAIYFHVIFDANYLTLCKHVMSNSHSTLHLITTYRVLCMLFISNAKESNTLKLVWVFQFKSRYQTYHIRISVESTDTWCAMKWYSLLWLPCSLYRPFGPDDVKYIYVPILIVSKCEIYTDYATACFAVTVPTWFPLQMQHGCLKDIYSTSMEMCIFTSAYIGLHLIRRQCLTYSSGL